MMGGYCGLDQIAAKTPKARERLSSSAPARRELPTISARIATGFRVSLNRPPAAGNVAQLSVREGSTRHQ
jgi:hypothetical protein